MEDFIDFLKEVGLPIIIMSVIVMIIIMTPVYYSSCVKARLFNRMNNTSWTCYDFFWAESQINSQTQTINLKQE